MKPIVARSINDMSAQRCVDILRADDGFAWVECRRDPEDGHGWRRLFAPRTGFPTEDAALQAAGVGTPWLRQEGHLG